MSHDQYICQVLLGEGDSLIKHSVKNKMLKSEVQHQFWITKKAVQRKLGSKEDEHIVSSDAVLDSKILLFKSISETCTNLNKIIDLFQERLCVLSQEECTFGRFLKEIGKRSKTTGASITNSGKAIYYCGQQRMSLRGPLVRLQHEVDVFRCQAVADTFNTINHMEKERTEYRAALCWMKSLSMQLDPDNDKGLDKFRRAQSYVRNAKENFDKLSMDCIQKIDLLAAARCNMFSHGLAAYMAAILQFAKKSESTFKTVSSSLVLHPRYDFCVLKDLSQHNAQEQQEVQKIQMNDNDQSMFFSEEFHDNESKSPKTCDDENPFDNILIELSQAINEIDNSSDSFESNLSKIWCDESHISKYMTNKPITKSREFLLGSYASKCPNEEPVACDENASKQNIASEAALKKTKNNNWFDLFSELDPLENLQSFDLKLNGKSDTQQT